MKLLIESINTILYHNTSVNNLDSILRDGLLVSRSNSEDASNYKCIWATDRPLRLEYGGVTLQINLPDNIRYEEDEGYYLIYDDIPPQYIKIIDYPLFKEKLSYKLSDIRNLMDRYPKEKIKQLILTYKNDLIFDLEKTKQLTNFLDWSIEESNITHNSIIINPEDNIIEASKLNNLLRDYKRKIACKRDNCGFINSDLKEYLINKGIDRNDIKVIRGSFKTDNLNLIDKFDLTKDQRRLLVSEYGDTSNSSIIKFLKKHYKPEYIDDFHILPHTFLKYKNLILDDASKMFLKGLDKPITKNNYIEEEPNYLNGSDYLKEDIDNKIPSKFDKWLGYDFGGIRTFAKGLEFKDTPDNWYYYEETWNFIGRRSDGRYYFECTFSYDEDMIGKILSFPRFNDVAYMVALPGRNY